MNLRSFSIRTYLLLSYLTLILLLTVGMWAIADRLLDRMREKSQTTAETLLENAVATNIQLSETILTKVGEFLVKDKAQDVARELAYVLGKKKVYNYEQLRLDAKIRDLAVQPINTPMGPAGYTDLYDIKGEIIFHPDRRAEGQNQLVWRGGHPTALALLKRSLTEDVSGYYTSLDEKQKARKRYGVRLHVPGTPFIVSVVVNIDEFFLPTHEKIVKDGRKIIAQAREDIKAQELVIARQVKLGSLIAGAVFGLLGGLGGLWFAAVISRPIARLRDGVRQVGEGNFAVAVPERGVKEVVHLAHSFNQLGLQLTDYMEKRDFIRDTFGRYVTQDVAKKLLESKGALEMGGETREVSMIMSDLRGFTALTADMAPEEVITFLNRYLGKMIEILLDYHAVIDEIVGDGILAFFGAPELREDHPERAVACALAMQAAMEEINFLNEADGLPHLEMGIGVNTGTVVVGNIGSEKRTKYSVIGSPVNFTSRAESFSVGGQVLLGAATYERVKDLVEVGEVLHAEMKGVPEALTLYEVLAISGPYNIRLKEKADTLVPLKENINVQVYRIHDKIITGATGSARITQLSEVAATVVYEGELGKWEDVRLHFLDENQAEIPGKVYGKVISVKPLGDHRHEAGIRFTSVSRDIQQLISRTIGSA